MSLQNVGYRDEEEFGENFQLQDHSGNGSMDHDLVITRVNQDAGSLFRSEEMALCQLFLQSEAAYACVAELGELGLVQFRDLNPDTNAFQRKFVNEVRRADEMERKLKFLESEIKKDGIRTQDSGDSPDAPPPREMSDLESTFEKLEQELQEVNQNTEALKKNYLELTELKHILRKTQQFFDEQDQLDVQGHYAQNQQLIPEESVYSASRGVHLGFVAGVIGRERLPAFEKMLWRACRGNVFLRQAEIEDPLEDPQLGGSVRKSVFLLFFQGEQLKIRVKKICEGFRATLYPCPDLASDRREMAVGVMQRLEDLNTVISQTNDHRQRVLSAAAKNIKMWFVKVRKIKAIYHTLNLFNIDVTTKCLIAECWIPTGDLSAIQMALRRGSDKSGSSVGPVLNQMSTHESPPTFFRTNKLTGAFQELIDAYGVASYREANPAVFTIITFPFLFAIMFGDAGHGLIVLAFGLWMCLRERQLEAKKIDSEIWQIFFGGRYLITLMGIFSIYTGLIYNDIFSKSMNIFGSSWQVSLSETAILSTKHDMINPASNHSWYGSPYPFGVDPAWQLAENKIVFLNGFKMKISIIIGVLHMLFGVCISFWNNQYFRKPLNTYTEFIPQILFLSCLFGYLALLMFIKWAKYYANADEANFPLSERCAPSILITFINMVLFRANVAEEACGDPYMYAGERPFQMFLVLVAVICVPWMLLAKPLILRRAHMQKMATGTRFDVNGHGGGHGDHGDHHHGDSGVFDFTEVIILQGIHTIEYALGSVSHTASYLRLWALSLAHAQLSEVLWNMVMRIGLRISGWYGGVILWAIFAFWAVLTVSILCLMEGLSAFLHTLRLHWVEFQSKFYKGDGHIFAPFSFKTILKQSEAANA